MTRTDRVTSDLVGAKKYAEATKAADAYSPLAGDRAGEVKCPIYDGWGQALAADGKWEDALKKYAEGIKAHPTDSDLKNNALATVDQWADKSIKNKDWKEAIRIYDV